jgi:hypothetical protein
MICVGFEPTIPASKQAKTVRALDRWATVIGEDLYYLTEIIKDLTFHSFCLTMQA